MSKPGIKFLGSMCSKFPGLSFVGRKANVAFAVIDVGVQAIGLASSLISYSEEKNRTQELRKQINMQKDVIDEVISTAIEKSKIELEMLKNKMHLELVTEERRLKNELEIYKKEIELKTQNINYSYLEDKEAQRITRNMCKNLSSIITAIGERLNEVTKIETDKSFVYSLQEDYREVQSSYNKLIKTLI